ncbi:hypothetical protein EW145_g5326 [Phellinidium pouzarii]|uniref:hydroxyacylglutathione hydrolase n=1 Tax=Phellinidium pouzarii TaxID=167371 RepID=A0A4S4L547_9AGAM|nr:hypothetical protein EW145_g5326 [Phellinidium pouzarii]
MKVVPVPVRDDNYAYLLIDDSTNEAAVVDPFDMTKVQAAADKEGVKIVANLTTHHHFDHSGGNEASSYPDAPIYGGSTRGAADKVVKDTDVFSISEQLNVNPAPSLRGIRFFLGGCGRFFEGNASDMHQALSYLGSLPDSTVVYNGHEYTKNNLAFIERIEPHSPGVLRLRELVRNAVTTGKSTIADEKEWNVFMRLSSKEVLNTIGANLDADAASIMDTLRTMKNKM